MAREARAIAMQHARPGGEKKMLEIADSYDRLPKGLRTLARRRSGENEPVSDYRRTRAAGDTADKSWLWLLLG